MSQNRRSARRFPGKGCRVDFTHRGKFLFSKEVSFNHRLVDISEGGVRFKHPDRLKVGTSLTLTIHQPQTFLPLVIRGKVAWCDRKGKGSSGGYSTGVRFVQVRPRMKQQLQQLIDTLSGYFEVPAGSDSFARAL